MQAFCQRASTATRRARPGLAFTGALLSAVLACCVAQISSAASSAASGPLRLAGSFMQYSAEMQSWPPATWVAVLDTMQEANMNTVIVQMLVEENSDGTLYSFIGPSGQPDATETILDYADTNGFEVFLGLYSPNWDNDMTASNFLYDTQAQMAVVAQQAWNRYLSGNRHSSFAGWYIPYEPWTADYTPEEVQLLRSFFQAIHASCQAISGHVPVAVAPFISSDRPSPCQVEQLYQQILDQSGIGILLLQDSVGAQDWETNIVEQVAPYFQAFQNACKATGVRFWDDLECFQITNSTFAPCSAARMKKQFYAAAPYVEEFITFDFLNYMNPVAFLSSWDQTRREQMQQLYSNYMADFVDTDYAPFAPPGLSASISGTNLLLQWGGIAEDQFQVQVKTNLADASWTPLTTLVLTTNAAGFSVAAPFLAQTPTRYYRVQKLPSLQVPDSMIYILPGTFLMGTPSNDPNRTPEELTQFEVTLTSGFWIHQFEVTQSEYQNLTCLNPSTFTGDLERPVENVSWSNAMNYCALLTQQERQALRLPDGYVYRLPTEAEWEYAARAGTTNWFSFGDDPSVLTNYAWFESDSQSTTHPVGQLQPNPWGLQDVYGNVFEWCWDWIESAPTQPVTNFQGATNGLYHAIRGGASSSSWIRCRCSWRMGYSPVSIPSDAGFRIVLAPAGP